MRQEITARIWEIADRAARTEDIEIVDIEFLGGGKHRLVRIYIDKEGGVSHADCESISSQVGTALDAEDVISGGEYTLEVSSPGVERKLARPRDFEKAVGKRIKVVLLEKIGKTAVLDGVLQAFADNVLTLEAAGGEVVQLPLDKLKKANLKFEW